MTLEEFQENCNGAPWTEDEFAYEAQKVEDCPELVAAATNYLQSKDVFLDMLTSIDVEMG